MPSDASDRPIAFLLPDLRMGGVERLTVDLVEELLGRGFKVDLVLLQRSGELLAQVPHGARIVELGAGRLRNAIGPLRHYLRETRPVALCAALWPLTVVALIAALGLGRQTRVVVAEHCSLVEQYRGSFLLRATVRASYRLADAIVCTSDGVAGEIAGLAGLDRKRVTTIYNPVKPPPVSGTDPTSLWGEPQGKRILAVGRLKAQKNFALLLAAFAELLREREAVLAIVGEGEERPKLEAAIRTLGLGERVLLPGLSLTPGDWYQGADLFVLSSDYEGFALVLAEAMHFGLPIVSTDCPHGPAEVLGHGRWGRLVPVGDAPALARAMAAALESGTDAGAQRARANEFGVARAADEYLRVLLGAA
jgi:glycosyltransferase involved in cell wall biosynthesis